MTRKRLNYSPTPLGLNNDDLKAELNEVAKDCEDDSSSSDEEYLPEGALVLRSGNSWRFFGSVLHYGGRRKQD